MSQYLKSPKLRFFLVVGATPLFLAACYLASFSLHFPLSVVSIPLLMYWAFALWFVLSATASKHTEFTKTELFVIGFWTTVAIFLTVVIALFALPAIFFMGV